MTSRGQGEGTWSPFRLPTNLLTTMMMLMMVVMMSPYASALIEMKNISPANGFTIGGTIHITCEYNAKNVQRFMLFQNKTNVVTMTYQSWGNFRTLSNEKDFGCYPVKYGVIQCHKRNANCEDVGAYTCALSNTDVSKSKLITVRSGIKSLELLGSRYPMSMKNEYKCEASAVKPFPQQVVFNWEVEYTNGNGFKEMKRDVVPVMYSHTCSAEVKSTYTLHLSSDDMSFPVIKCSAFNQTISKVIKSPDIDDIITNTCTGVVATKWIVGHNLLLLLLAVAISH